MSSKPRAFYMGVLTAMVIILGAITLFGIKAYAIDDVGPDAGEFDGANIYYELSHTSNVTSTTMTIPLYYLTRPTAAVSVLVTCGDGGGSIKTDYINPTNGNHVNIDNGLCNGNLSLPPAAFPTDADANTGYFEADLVFSLNDTTTSNYKAFKLNIRDNAKIGYAASNSTHFAVANLDRCDFSGDSGCGKYFQYSIPFAPACNVASGKQTFRLLDPDNPSGSAPYGIQPNAFTVKLVESKKDGTITDGSVSWKKTVTRPGDANNELDSYEFDYKQGRNYQLVLSKVYANNVIQFQLPFDSINYSAPCLAGTASGVSGGCDSITGYIYDKYAHSDDDNPSVKYYIAINPASGDPQKTYSNEAALTSDLDIWTSGNANDNTPAADSNGNGVKDIYGHGFTVDVPASSYRDHRYAGPWQANTYVVYGREYNTAVVRRIKVISVDPCASATCTSGYTTFTAGAVGQSNPFKVWYKANTYAGNPLPDSYFIVHVLDPDGNDAYYNDGTKPATADEVKATLSSGLVTTPEIPFKATKTGTYTVRWQWDGPPSCSTDDKAGYQPFFDVTVGDISAGNAFGDTCVNNASASIESWNNNSGALVGASSTLGAIATGNVQNFVSGLGLGADGAQGSGYGLSFANVTNIAGTTGDHGYGGQFGDETSLPCVHNYAADKKVGLPPLGSNISSATVSGLASNPDGYQATPAGSPASVTIGSGVGSDIKLGAGQQVTIYASGCVYLKSNILYNNYGSLADIPQFKLVVTGVLYIDSNVTNLHGVYVVQKSNTCSASASGGTMATCSTAPGVAISDYDTCNKQLTFTGAVATEGKIFLERTYGSLVAAPGIPTEPAEIFRFSPELWLNSKQTNSLVYQSYTGLPPILQ